MADAIIPNAASYLQLYSAANERPSTEWQVECKDTGVTFKDAKDRDWIFKAQAYKFQDKAGLNEINLRVKVAQGDSERTANASAASVADGKAVAEAVAARAAEAGLDSKIDAEIARAGAAESVLASADTTNANAMVAAVAAEAALRVASDGVLTAAIAAEEARATGIEAGLSTQIVNLIGGSPATLQSLAALVLRYDNLDDDQQDILDVLLVDVAQLRSEVDILTNQSQT